MTLGVIGGGADEVFPDPFIFSVSSEFRPRVIVLNCQISLGGLMMWTDKMTRTGILRGLHIGWSAKEGIDFFDFPKSTVYDMAKRFHEYSSEDISLKRK